MADQSQRLAQAGGGAAGGANSVLAGKAVANQPAAIQRIRGQHMKQPQKGLRPDQAAQQMGRGDEWLLEEPHIAAGAQDGGG